MGSWREAATAAAGPERVALAVDGGDDLTYEAWEGRSNAIARGLAARGCGAGDRVGVLFDGRHWADFATAHLGVMKAGGVAVLLSPGAGAQELARALTHSEATGLLWARDDDLPAVPTWVASPEEVARGHDSAPTQTAAEPSALAELVYPPAPLAAPRPWVRTHGELAVEGGPAVDGCLVHTWAPGSPAGQYAMGLVRAARATAPVALAVFDPDRLCALVAERHAGACGLTPALAAAVLASDAPRQHDLRSVTRVVLSGPPSPALLAGLQAAFPGAAVTGIDGAPPASAPLADDAARAPVAVSQEGMLWHEQFTPGSFNLPCLVRRYQGPLDGAALEWALSEVVRRHQPLRSTFDVVEGEASEVVGDHGASKLAMVDLGGLQPTERDAEAARLLADATGRPFDLATGPLFEPRLVRLGTDDHLLVVRLHHTAFDDWSVDVFRRELSALYSARLAGAPSPLVEPPTTFADFCRRQRARLYGDAGAAQRAWWRQELDGAPLAVQLPIGDQEGAGARPEPGEPLRLDLPPSLAADLRALAPRLRATPFMTVLAAFSVLLARSTGQDDLLIATVVASRNQSDVEPLVGCFTKKVPLRLRLGGDPTFGELVARTRASLLGSLSHQEVSFDVALQEALGGPAADHGVVPQVAVVFQGETPQQVKLALPGLATGPYEAPGGARRERHFSSGPERTVEDDFPVWGDGIYLGTFLILSLLETADGMALVARGVFHRPVARRLLGDFQALLADVAAEPSRPISALTAAGVPAGGGPEGDLVDFRGFRAGRSRLEAALARCPGVADVAVAVRDTDAGDPRLVAYVVADGDAPPTLARLRHSLWADLPGAIWPAEMVVVDALPGLPPPRRSRPRESSEPDSGADPGAGLGVRATQAGLGVRATQAGLLAAMWGEIRGRPAGPGLRYWQDFSFLQVLAEARQAGLVIGDEEVVRSRTPDMLAAALTARSARG